MNTEPDGGISACLQYITIRLSDQIIMEMYHMSFLFYTRKHHVQSVTKEFQLCAFAFDPAREEQKQMSEAMLSTCLFLAAVLLVSFVLSGFEGLQTAAHVSLEHLPVLPLLIAHHHEVPTVVRVVLQGEREKCYSCFSVQNFYTSNIKERF